MAKVRVASTPIPEQDVPASNVGTTRCPRGLFVVMDESPRVSINGDKLAGVPAWRANGACIPSSDLPRNRVAEP